MPRIISIARSSPTRSSVVRCSDTSARCRLRGLRRHLACLHPFLCRRAPGSPDRTPSPPPAGISGRAARTRADRVRHGGYAGVMSGRWSGSGTGGCAGACAAHGSGRRSSRSRWSTASVLVGAPVVRGRAARRCSRACCSPGSRTCSRSRWSRRCSAARCGAARPDLPRLVASDYAGTWLLLAITAALFVGGLAHRPGPRRPRGARARRARRARLRGRTGAEYAAGLVGTDAIQLEPGLYRACVPGDERRALCLFVSTDQRPPGIIRDRYEGPNSIFRARAADQTVSGCRPTAAFRERDRGWCRISLG